MNEETYDIQKLVQESGVPRRTIYFYVQQGILPPPEGAGLASSYGREHLLRLKMIPILRAQGLRLDDIRHKLGAMSADEMAQAVAGTALKPQPPLMPEPIRLNESRAPIGRAVTVYDFPGGVAVLAPAGQSAEDELRLKKLLQAAAEIYAGTGRLRPDNGHSPQPTPEDQDA